MAPMPEITISSVRGLSSAEAAQRLRRDGPNELPAEHRRSLFTMAIDVVREPMIAFLVAGGGIYLVLGDLQEALMLMGSVVIVILITLYQEGKTERALDALRELSSPRALVVRDGQPQRVAGREVVVGDSIVLSEGDRVPADGALLSAHDLSVDESLLTGESVPVRKVAGNDRAVMERPGGDERPWVFSGTLVVQGQGIARVLAIGADTQLGRIGRSLQQLVSEPLPLQRHAARIARRLAIVGLVLCALVVVLYGTLRGGWLDAVLAGITMAMSLLPEEIPVVLTVFLALGAWRMSRRRVLTRRMPAVEALGSATVLAVDKTGTLTMNRMSVSRLLIDGRAHVLNSSPVPEAFHELIEYSVLASEVDAFDPMEQAFQALGRRALPEARRHAEWRLVHEYPLTPRLLALTHAWQRPDGRIVLATKGAPEAVARLCRLSGPTQEQMMARVREMAERGLRVLAVAKAVANDGSTQGGAWPADQTAFDWSPVGLIGLEDPVRPGVVDAVAECKTAGLRVVMITGDYSVTAQAIGRQIGLPVDAVVTGDALEALSDAELRQHARSAAIYARVVPEQKLRIVEALKAEGEIVAMTGDGVNDAPALKAAHIGIAMGARGTDVAREAASLVLLDDDFASIVEAVRMGRRIFDNLRKALGFVLAVHLPIAGLALLPLIAGWPLIFFPVHIVFLELIIDPICSIGFEAEPEEADVMRRPPRRPDEPLIGGALVRDALLQGAGLLAIVAALYAALLGQGAAPERARAIAFSALVVGNLAMIGSQRSRSPVLASARVPNSALWIVLAAAAASLVLSLTVPWLRGTFGFAPLSARDAALCLAAGLASLVWDEAVKALPARARRLVSPHQT
jgi:Ca2+-transporting ATPase